MTTRKWYIGAPALSSSLCCACTLRIEDAGLLGRGAETVREVPAEEAEKWDGGVHQGWQPVGATTVAPTGL